MSKVEIERDPEFMISVKTGSSYHIAFIKIDKDRQGRDQSFYFDVVKNSFPTRQAVNIMISNYRRDSDKTLYSKPTFAEVQEVLNKRTDLLFGMIFEDTWRYIPRTESV